MKQIFILFAIITSVNAHGQKSLKKNQTSTHKRVLIGLSFSPDYGYRTLKSNGTASGNLVRNSRNDVEISKMGFTAGADLCINFNQLLGIETGLHYSNKGYQTKKQDLVFAQPIPGQPIKVSFIYRYNYLDIPLMACFSFGKTRLRIIAGAGLEINALINATQKNEYEYPNGNTEKNKLSSTANFKKFNISPMISCGISYAINGKMVFRAAPAYRYGLIKTTDTPVGEHLWSAGLNIGLYYKLK